MNENLKDVMNDYGITQSVSVKVVNFKIVKQADGMRRFRLYEYITLMESICKFLD